MTALEVVDGKTGELIPYEQTTSMTLFGTLDPDRAITEASRYAKSLAKVVDQQKLFTQIGPSKHIRVEGWQTLGAMTGVFAVGEGEPEPVEINGIAGFKATVVAMRNGEIIGRATSYCMRDEDRWKAQPTHAVASMAQTRATSKALKGPLGFIVKLAGYSSTPAEEMPDPPRPKARQKAPVETLDTSRAEKRMLELVGEKGGDVAAATAALAEQRGTDVFEEWLAFQIGHWEQVAKPFTVPAGVPS